GAGGLPTLKLGVVYRATLDGVTREGVSELRYHDMNFPARAGWKEVVAVGDAGATLVSSSVPERDRSRELGDYPTSLLDIPPQDLEARVVFTRETTSTTLARTDSTSGGASAASPDTPHRPPVATILSRALTTSGGASAAPPPAVTERPAARNSIPSGQVARSSIPSDPVAVEAAGRAEPFRLQANQQGTPRNAFTELVTAQQLGLGVVLFALVVAASLGA